MARTTSFILGTVALALAAAAVLVVTNVVDVRQFFPPSEEAGLVVRMNDIVARGGYVATFSEADGEKWHLAGGHKLERFSVDRGDAAFARLTSSKALDPATPEWPSQGLSVALPVEFNNKSSGRSIEIGIVARVSPTGPGGSLSLVYATRQAGNSGWQRAAIGDKFELKTFRYDVPTVEGAYTNPPVLVLNADPSGQGGSVELLGVYLKIL